MNNIETNLNISGLYIAYVKCFMLIFFLYLFCLILQSHWGRPRPLHKQSFSYTYIEYTDIQIYR